MPTNGRGRGRLPEATWDAIREKYENGQSAYSLSREFEVRRDTIRAHASKNNWTLRPGVKVSHGGGLTESRLFSEAIQSNVIDIQTKRISQKLEESGKTEEIANSIAKSLARHGAIGERLLALVESYMERAEQGLIEPSDKQNEADVLNSMVTATRNALLVTREINGLRVGQSSDAVTEKGASKPSRLNIRIVDSAKDAEAS